MRAKAPSTSFRVNSLRQSYLQSVLARQQRFCGAVSGFARDLAATSGVCKDLSANKREISIVSTIGERMEFLEV